VIRPARRTRLCEQSEDVDVRTLSKQALPALALFLTVLLVACGGAATSDMAPAAEMGEQAAPTTGGESAMESQSEPAVAGEVPAELPAAANNLTGTVTYLERMALDPSAVITVQLEDVTVADAPSTVVAEQRIQAEGRQVPIPFDMPYDPATIDPARLYSLSARIEDGGGKLLFISDTRVPVLTGGSPSQAIDITVVPAMAVGTSDISGTVTYDPALPVPADAVLTVQIQDITLQDVASTIVAEQVIPIQGQLPPLPFAVAYDPAVILPGNLYSMAARVTDAGGNLLLISDTVTPVLTNGAPADDVQVTLVPVQ
jgi:putative lipoprotein